MTQRRDTMTELTKVWSAASVSKGHVIERANAIIINLKNRIANQRDAITRLIAYMDPEARDVHKARLWLGERELHVLRTYVEGDTVNVVLTDDDA